MKTLLNPALLAILAACTTPQPSQETEVQCLIRQQQDAADFATLQLEKNYERMTTEERMRGIVYGE
ncbi:hypothetical protein HMPREF3025_00875 [Neisseria sp. HMSC070E12]|jgi:hypothetical protein|nr:hypothetical protein HMPREF3025_00875 [Neisseria sp. HMSC070E12]